MNPYVRLNRALWDEWTEINVRSQFYDVDGFRRAPPPLDRVVRDGVGDLTGRSVLHLQCHFGMDTIRLAQTAREVVGVDFSANAIRHARALAADLGARARFVESDVYDLPAVLDGEFDLVFTSVGVLSWLPDLARWGQIVARYVRPGGAFFLVEGHPTMMLFDERTGEPPVLTIKYPYFHDPEPIVEPAGVGMYADPTAVVTHAAYGWAHSMSEIVMALLDAGLVLEELREHRHVMWQAFPYLVEETPPGEEPRWVAPPGAPQLPLMFSLRATKPVAR